MRVILLLVIVVCGASVCGQYSLSHGETVEQRFSPPRSYKRLYGAEGSFAQYLRRYPLYKQGSPVRLFDGRIKQQQVHAAVFRMELLDKDLIQCADAIIKLRAEYLYETKNYDAIVFSLTNGMRVPYSRYARGERVKVSGNKTDWIGGRQGGYGREVFDAYLAFIYAYAGTLSLSREMRTVDIGDIRIGDVFIFGGSPGHAVLVCDLALDAKSGKKVMLLGQSYMPSQQFHILKSYEDISPWYYVRDEILRTPEWTFERGSLKRFDN